MNPMNFNFHSVGRSPETNSSLVVRVPSGINDKQSLLKLIAQVLLFPAYFGQNWDSLDECLADLSWLKCPLVHLWHEDIPLIADRDEARRYLKILEGVLEEPGVVPLTVSFPESVRKEAEALVLEPEDKIGSDP
jgi:hypothetical protein